MAPAEPVPAEFPTEPTEPAAPAQPAMPAAGSLAPSPAPAAEVRPSPPASAPTPTNRAAVAEQVVAIVAPLRRQGDGAHTIQLELRPSDLGTVRVDVTVDAGTVHLSLSSPDDSTANLLRHAMPELRAALEDAGLSAGRLGVGPGGGDDRQPGGFADPSRRDSDDGPDGRRLDRDAPDQPLPGKRLTADRSAVDVLL